LPLSKPLSNRDTGKHPATISGGVRLQPDLMKGDRLYPDLPWITACLVDGMLHRHPEPLEAFSCQRFHRYFLTFCANQRARVFTSNAVVDLVLAQMSRAAAENAFAVIAYCFMPDHLHLLIEGRSEVSAARVFIKAAKQYSGFYYSKAYGQRLWQRYGFDHVLRDDEKAVVVARYILMNPVRAKLCERIEDYPFAGSLVYPLPALLDWKAKG
jgi:putative transposase